MHKVARVGYRPQIGIMSVANPFCIQSDEVTIAKECGEEITCGVPIQETSTPYVRSNKSPSYSYS